MSTKKRSRSMSAINQGVQFRVPESTRFIECFGAKSHPIFGEILFGPEIHVLKFNICQAYFEFMFFSATE